jgi:pimeloyl-ACP methyl ester carboxylesterase
MNAAMQRTALLALVLSIQACADVSNPRPVAAHKILARTDEMVDGKVGGAYYRLFRPADWNGRLVLYAHGTVSPDQPVKLPGEAPLVTALFESLNTAVALSSFSENGWAVKDGAQRTHQLLGLFTATFGAPRQTYVVGASQGGLIATMLAEKHPEEYTGAVSLCAPNAGATANFTYAGHVRTLFDYFYPGVLPGHTGLVPEGIDVTEDIVRPARAAMAADPTGAAAIAGMAQTPVPGETPEEVQAGVARALHYHGELLNNLLGHTHGHSLFDNRATVYTGALPPEELAALNAGVARYEGSEPGERYMNKYYDPNGELAIPMLAIYTTRDPNVPMYNHEGYRDIVAGAGRSHFLFERAIDRFGHCNFSLGEMVQAWHDLVRWAEEGVRPAS